MESSKTLLIFGNCEGHFNGYIQCSFKGDHFLIVKSDGTVLVHSMASGILPICLISHTHIVAIEHLEGDDPAIKVEARDRENVLGVTFEHIYSMVGIPEDNVTRLLKAAFSNKEPDYRQLHKEDYPEDFRQRQFDGGV